MLEKLKLDFDDMVMAIPLWLCTLPLVGLLIIPLFGVKVGLLVAVGLFFAATIVCWGICSWKLFKK